MKTFIFALILTTSASFAIEPSSKCAFQDEVSSDFLGFSYLVCQFYKTKGFPPKSVDDLLSMVPLPTDKTELTSIVKSKFADLKFKTEANLLIVSLTYSKAPETTLTGSLIYPIKETVDLMIQNMTVKGDLKKLEN